MALTAHGTKINSNIETLTSMKYILLPLHFTIKTVLFGVQFAS